MRLEFGLFWLTFHIIIADDRLIFLQIIWRHGDRTPAQSYPTDIHQESAWPQGWGELTELGMKQQYALGRLIRERYIVGDTPFLSSTYKAKEIYIRSTDVNRTLISAMANMAGMYPHGVPGTDYPKTKNETWPSHWTPVPVHTVEFQTDHIGNAFAICPRVEQLNDYIRASKPYQKYLIENEAFFKFLSKKTGMQVDLTNIAVINDVHTVEKIHQMIQPDWMTDEVAARILNLTQVSNKFTLGVSKPYVPEMIKLRGGSLLKTIIDKMVMKIECLNEAQNADCRWIRPLKYYAYSAHDTTVAALLATLGDVEQVIKGGLPEYTASVAIELWNRTGIGLAVKILFHSASNQHKYYAITRFTKGCPPNNDFCPLSQFVRRSKRFVPYDIEYECKARKSSHTRRTRLIYT